MNEINFSRASKKHAIDWGSRIFTLFDWVRKVKKKQNSAIYSAVSWCLSDLPWYIFLAGTTKIIMFVFTEKPTIRLWHSIWVYFKFYKIKSYFILCPFKYFYFSNDIWLNPILWIEVNYNKFSLEKVIGNVETTVSRERMSVFHEG